MDPESRRAKHEQIEPTEEDHRRIRRDHPLEEALKNPHTVLEQQMEKAEEDIERPAGSLLLSGLSAGLDLGFGPFAMAVIITLTSETFPRPVTELLTANAYAIGFIFVVMGRSVLFTEQTTSAVQPLLAGRISLGQLLRTWGLVLVANVAGGALFAWFAVTLGPALGVAEPFAFGEIARKLVEHSWSVMLLSAIGAGWLMGLLVWLVTASRTTFGQIFFVWLTTMVIGLGQMHHSIAGTIEVLMGVFVGEGATLADYGRFLLWSVLGNAIGGAVFVAGLKYAHVRRDSAT
jgi:formate/nitrite transporter FocA (FNT family)